MCGSPQAPPKISSPSPNESVLASSSLASRGDSGVESLGSSGPASASADPLLSMDTPVSVASRSASALEDESTPASLSGALASASPAGGVGGGSKPQHDPPGHGG